MIDLPDGAVVTVLMPEPPVARVPMPPESADQVTVMTYVGAPPIAGYLHSQSTPAATWSIFHGLATRWPHVTVVLEGDTEPVYPDMTHPSLGVTSITFPTAQAGQAYLS